MFGSDAIKGKKSNKIMQYMMMSEMLKGNSDGNNAMSAMMPFMMMNGGMADMFDGMFDFDEDEETESEEE